MLLSPERRNQETKGSGLSFDTAIPILDDTEDCYGEQNRPAKGVQTMQKRFLLIAIPVAFVVIAAAVFTGIKLSQPNPEQAGEQHAQGLLKALDAAPEEAAEVSDRHHKKTLCEVNLRGLQTACLMYDSAYDCFPPNLQTLVDAKDIPPGQTACPNSGKPYIYIEGQSLMDDERNILVYEPEGSHSDGAHVVHLLGGVEFIRDYSVVERLVEETKVRIAERASADPS